MTVICSLFDLGYGPRAMTMLESSGILRGDMSVLVLAPAKVSDFSTLLSGVRLTSEVSFVESNSGLFEVLRGRNRPEQIFTLGPAFVREAMNDAQEGEWVVYCDADLSFFSPLEEILAPYSESSALVVPHRHYLHNRVHLRKFGHYNVGLVAFRNDADGKAMLDYWAGACADWCRDFPENDKYADQKYLERFHLISSRLAVDTRLGSNVAPWNASFKRPCEAEGQLFINRHRVLYAHMQGLTRYPGGWTLGHLPFVSLASRRLRGLLYLPYLAKLEEWASIMGLQSQANSRLSYSLWKRALRKLSFSVQVLLGQYIPLKKIERYRSDSAQRP